MLHDREARIFARGLERFKQRHPEHAADVQSAQSDADANMMLESQVAAQAQATGHPILDAIANLLGNPQLLMNLIAFVLSFFGIKPIVPVPPAPTPATA